jgi:transporter family-2 protein
MMKYIYIVIVLIIGCIVSIQGSINTQLTTYLKNPLQGALVNFFVGFISLICLNVIFRVKVPTYEIIKVIPFYLFLGGFLGVVFVTSVIFFIPKLGVSTVLAASIAGQMITASIIDHFGLFGFQPISFNITRFIGCVFLLIGVMLIQNK